MTTTISWGYTDLFGCWVLVVTRNGKDLALMFRDSEAECRAWAERNIIHYARGRHVNLL